ncbi:uncharacterized protein LOC107263731 [Cephus cinctus]|uniref:Uncharacterized protein LOC107263731 n=1 Tax=Cephus cinctus TaxID=211228 RepID=A0AAJ7R9K8_CEPCN|nr:uncharacterized protein LOC107263731 [Cephus cinctus]
MRNIWSILLIICSIKLLTSSWKINQQCEIQNNTRLACVCSGNEVLQFPKDHNLRNISNIFISSCSYVNLHISDAMDPEGVRNIIIRNISRTLIFDSTVMTKNIENIEFLNIGVIHRIAGDSTFKMAQHIKRFRIEDTNIENFNAEFQNISVTQFLFRNVTIARMIGLNFSKRGELLKIINCTFRNIQSTLHFIFSTIEIRNSKFELQKPTDVSIVGDNTVVANSVFLNVSMNLVASNKIAVNNTCADGKSSLRLSARSIESFGNRLPTEIIYPKNMGQDVPGLLLARNNTVCIAGNCKCIKSNAVGLYGQLHGNIFNGIMLSIFILSL